MVATLAVLLFFQLLGELLARTAGLPLPGPVAGLLLLAAWLAAARVLRLGWARPGALDGTADTLVGTLGLMFVPAGVGVLQQLSLLGSHAVAIAVTLVLSTIITLAVTVWTFLAIKRLAG